MGKDLTIGKGAVLLGKTGTKDSLDGGKTYLGLMGDEVRTALKEIAALRRLPEVLDRLDRLSPKP